MKIEDLIEDWGGFEKLLAKLHETGEVTVEHDVVLQGRSGAPRQIDVLVRHKQGSYEHLIVVECKYWNSSVERLHVDALATTVREVGASRGVIFSTKGFQGLSVCAFPFSAAPAVALAGTATSFSLASLFLVFLKVGAVVFGSGYVLLAFLRADLVVHHGWLTDSQLVDAVAVGQLTSGPVFTTATFVGYLLGGVRGATVATVGVFLPAFLLIAASGPLVPRFRRSKIAGTFLDGVNVGSLALMAEVSWQLGRASVVDVVTIVLAVSSLIALLQFRLNSGWLVVIGAIIGLIASAFHIHL